MPDQIDRLECFAVAPRWAFLKITTSEGIVGWGEPIVEGKAHTTISAVNEFADLLIGMDPDRIEDVYQSLYRGSFYRGGPILSSAISGIDQALWDIKGKRYGVPAYELMGGAVRNRIQAYGWISTDTDTPPNEIAQQRLSEGWTAFKMCPIDRSRHIETPAEIDRIVARVQTIREVIGWERGLALDFHGRAPKSLAKTLIRELEPVRPMFIEEPVLPEQEDALADLASRTTIPIATGERVYGRCGFKKLIQNGAVDILQPDLSHAGGLWEVRKIAAAAETMDICIAPHAPLGPINLAASLQLDFCAPNAFIQETNLGIDAYTQYVGPLEYLTDPTPFRLADGCFARTNRPGLGIEIDEAKVHQAAKVGHRWRNPQWRHKDGAIAEW